MISEFAKEKVFWTRNMNMKLVKFIESKPSIWNPKHPKYTSVACRDQIYAEFAAKYGNEFTGKAVKDRWTNIRSTFTYYMRRVNASRLKGDGEVYKVSWHLWNACRFLLKVSKKTKKEGDAGSDPEEQNGGSEHNEISSSDEEVPEKPLSDVVTCQNIANSIANVFKGMQNNMLYTDSSKYVDVGQMVSKRLSQMNSYDAALISSKIMQILLLYDENNPVNPNNIKSEIV